MLRVALQRLQVQRLRARDVGEAGDDGVGGLSIGFGRLAIVAQHVAQPSIRFASEGKSQCAA